MKTLRRYLAREVTLSTLLVLGALLMLWLFYDLLQDLPLLRSLNMAQMLVLVAATIPGYMYELLPVAALIGTLFALAQLASNSEYGVMRASGVSPAQVGGVLLSVGLGFAAIVFVMGEYVVPQAEQLVQRVRAFSGSKPMVARAFESGFWFKDGNTFINIGSVMPDGSLRNVRVYEYRDNTLLARTIIAEQAAHEAGQQWKLQNIQETLFDNGVKVIPHTSMNWNTVLTPNMLAVLQVSPDRLSLQGLWEYIGHLRENRQDARRFEGALWGKFFYPLATCVLMLLALPFAQIQQRNAAVSSRIFIGILLGLVFIICNRLFSYLALLYEWPPFLGALLPGAIFLAAAGLMLWRSERR